MFGRLADAHFEQAKRTKDISKNLATFNADLSAYTRSIDSNLIVESRSDRMAAGRGGMRST
jgi:hypothetical protein